MKHPRLYPPCSLPSQGNGWLATYFFSPSRPERQVEIMVVSTDTTKGDWTRSRDIRANYLQATPPRAGAHYGDEAFSERKVGITSVITGVQPLNQEGCCQLGGS